MQGPYKGQQYSCMCSNCMRKKLLAAGKPESAVLCMSCVTPLACKA